MRSIFLIGFMGAGKTTLGKELAAKLKLKFIDLDEAVCSGLNFTSVSELIENKGIDFFRQAESETLKTLPVENAVVSTGGGTPCYYDSLKWMKENGTVVFINVNEGVLFSRLRQTALHERPLLKDLNEEGLKKFISEKMKERLPFYTQADVVFDPVKEKISNLCKALSK